MPPKILKSIKKDDVQRTELALCQDDQQELSNLRREMFELKKDMKQIRVCGSMSAQFGIITSKIPSRFILNCTNFVIFRLRNLLGAV
jgi:hypothetical protein